MRLNVSTKILNYDDIFTTHFAIHKYRLYQLKVVDTLPIIPHFNPFCN